MDTIIVFEYQQRQQHDAGKKDYTARITQQSFPDYRILKTLIFEPVQQTPKHPLLSKAAELLHIRFFRLCSQNRKRQILSANLSEQIAPALDEWGENSCLYPAKLPSGHWLRTLLPLPEFQSFDEIKWIRRLYPYAVNPHFIILGSVGCLPVILEELSRRMKSLTWIVPDFTYKDQAEEITEKFYEENGLAVNLRFPGEGTTIAGLRIPGDSFPEPVTVLDLSGDKYLPDFSPAPGSVWIDVYAVQEKRHRIRARGLKVRYCSLLDPK